MTEDHITTSWWGTLLPYLRRRSPSVIALASSAVVLTLLAVALPWPTKIALDNVLGGRPLPGWMAWLDNVPGLEGTTGQLVILGGCSILLFLLRAVVGADLQVRQRATGERMSFDCGADLLAAVQNRSLTQTAQTTAGDTIRRITFDSRAPQLLLVVILGMFAAVFNLVLMIIVTTGINGRLTLIAFGGALPLMIPIVMTIAPMRDRALAKATADGAIGTELERTLGSLPELQLNTAEPSQQVRFDDAVQERTSASMAAQRALTHYSLAVALFTATGTSLVYLIGGLDAQNGAITAGDLVVVSTYVASLFGPIIAVAALAQATAFARASAIRVAELLHAESGIPEADHPVALRATPRGSELRFENVTFGYESGRPVLHGIDLSIAPGEMIALVGSSGAGKSTLVSLIPRFGDPWDGRVTFDGIDIKTARLRDVRGHVSVVLQDSVLLPTTVAQNIAYGRPGASDSEIEAAARAANAAEFIETLPQGYDTLLGQWGATLSGGQRQRLSIARALLKESPILILDEPTSALDADAEAVIVDTLSRLHGTRTIIVIAHRLSTVRGADRVVVLEGGRITEVGTHEELLVRRGRYAEFHVRQLNVDTSHGTDTGNTDAASDAARR